MSRRNKSYRRAGPRVWIAACFLVAALFAWGSDDARLKGIVIDAASEFIPLSPIADLMRSGANVMGGGARAIDGDTLQLGDKRIRLHGIDAPEAKQTCYRGRRAWDCGTEAKRALENLISIADVRCTERSKDRYGRSVANCRAGREDVNAWMVRHGWAVAYRRYGGAAYAADEAQAQRKRAGVWAGRFVMPWDWRQGKR